MKKIQDMTIDEICELTEEQLDRRIKLECADQGIPLLKEPPTIEAFDLTKDVVAYKINGVEFYIKNQESAQELLKFLEKIQSDLFREKYDWHMGYDIKWLQREESEFSITTELFYRQDLVKEKEQFLIKRKNIKDQFEKEKKDYEESSSKYRKIANGVYADYYEAKRTKEQIQKAQDTFKEYVSLADGDQEKAKSFFDKAVKPTLSEEVYERVFQSDKTAPQN